MINMIQACSNFHCARVFIPNTRPGEISERGETQSNDSVPLDTVLDLRTPASQ